ncbi:hypothetical protein GCM10023190_21510 [Enteractinococcus fodinae]|uniref:Uncharacterized protein n=1 Tax=Enteractinococcus fodinae TaxID=684663 RepID=A0ABU2B3C5_9MICC|nr:hypothetical protein [Enteractinococcus fodinae]MDR7348090.1 hypothetical protein [Enteractinococcus fodinae]
MSDERARTINTLREIALALHGDQPAQAEEILDGIGPEANNGRPSAAQLSVVAMESLDAWYAQNQLQNGAVRLIQRDVPRSMRDVTTAVDVLASKGRALRSAASLLQRNPEPTVAGATAYLVTAALATVATQRGDSFDETLDALLPEQEVSEPATPSEPETASEPAQAAPAAATEEVVEVVDETADTSESSADGPQARYTAIVETQFMAGVKEFFQWMGESHAVTGTGLPKRADIKDVAATVGIDAEGVAKKPADEESVASDLDLTVPAAPRSTRYVTSAQAIPELMAFWTALQETELVEVTSTKIQPGKNAQPFGFEDFDQLDAAEELVATYVYQTLTLDADDDAAAQTAAFIKDSGSIDDTSSVLIPRLRQLESVGLLDVVDGSVEIPAPLRPAVTEGAARVSA